MDWIDRGLSGAALAVGAGAAAVAWLARTDAGDALDRVATLDADQVALKNQLGDMHQKIDLLVRTTAALGNKIGAAVPAAAAANVWDVASAGLEVLGDVLDDDD